MERFYTENTIYYHDTDAGGVVYYARYLEHLEESRHCHCKERGVVLGELARKGIQFPVVHLEVDYKAPARYADVIKIFTQVEKIGNSSIHFLQEIKKDTFLLVRVITIWACIDANFKTKAIPQEIKKALL